MLHAAPAAAVPLDAFTCVAGNTVDCAAGAVLRGEVSEEDGTILLTLANDDDMHAVIAGVYIESVWVEDIIPPLETEDVHLSRFGAPPVLPGAGSFEVAASVNAVPPSPQTGIGPGESAVFVLALAEGGSFADLLSDLRVGLHVIGMAEASASFIAEPTPEPIPEPTSLGLLVLGLAPLAWARRRT
jgi:hypothetical protein